MCRPWKFLLDTHVPHVLLMVIQLRSIKALKGMDRMDRTLNLSSCEVETGVLPRRLLHSPGKLSRSSRCAQGVCGTCHCLHPHESTPRKSFDCFLDGLLAPSA